ncbi:hypothetical protein [Rhizobium sp.]|uniref:hypothetical protein n=1 Tax=Rhizobium sp. TaxID=391 RepID=UPI0028A7C718
MSENNTFHPVYYFEDLKAATIRNNRLDREGDEIERLSGRVYRRAKEKHERKLDVEFGSISSADLDYRLSVTAQFSELHTWWGKQGRIIVDMSKNTNLANDELELAAPELTSQFCPPIFVHFGREHGLALAELPGEFIDGVYVIPTRPQNDDDMPPITLVAVCRRGGKSRATDKIEKLYLNASAMVVGEIQNEELSIDDGEALMVGDPSVTTAFKRAMCVYGEYLANQRELVETLDTMRSLPPLDETWDAWSAVVEDNAAQNRAAGI